MKNVYTKANTTMIRVVLIEDYKLIRIGLRSILEDDLQINVIGDAETGEQGMELVKQLHPDLVVLDLGLPGINGIEVAKQIKAFDESIKILILTSHENEEEVLAALAAGANAYCLKDIPSARLIEVIKAVHEGAAWLDPAIAGIAMDVFSFSQSRFPASTADLGLTEREKEVLALIVEGKSNSEMAEIMHVSVHTSKAHVCNILQKLSVSDRVKAAVKAVKENLV